MISDVIHKHFKMQPSLAMEEYALRLLLVCEALLDINEHSAEECYEISRIAEYLTHHQSAQLNNFERSELYGDLESYPFSTTLMLIRECHPEDEKYESFKFLCAMLARLLLSRDTNDYGAYLQFYKAFIRLGNPSLPCTTNFVTRATVFELQLELKKFALNRNLAELERLARFYEPVRERGSSTQSAKVASYLRQRMQLSDDISVEHIDALDADGEHITSVLHVTPEMTKLGHQEYLLFAKKLTGAQRAFYNAEVSPAWTLRAATPFELVELLNHIDENLIRENFLKIDAQTSKYLFLFFTKLLGISQPLRLTLVNAGSPKFNEKSVKANSISYVLDKRVKNELKHARITLNARLIDVKGPDENAKKHHYYTNDLLTIFLPEPLLSLLQNALSSVDASRRHEHDMSHALEIDEKNYQAWLKAQITAAGFKKFGITQSAFENTFLHFVRESIPEVTLNLLKQESTVQQHYILQSHREIAKQINLGWTNFIQKLGFRRITRVESPSQSMHLDNAGSEMTLRDDLLNATLLQVVSSAEQALQHHSLESSLQSANELAFYIYLRIAVATGLRPVAHPLPTREHYSSELRVMSVKDKVVHHKNERRLIILSERLCTLIDMHLGTADAVASKLVVNKPTHLVSRFSSEKKWESFSVTFVNNKLSKILNARVKNHSLRHGAAQSFLNSSASNGEFSQPALNLFMNHARASAYALSNHSLHSISDFTAAQQKIIETYDIHHLDNDMRVIELLRSLQNEFKL